MPPKIIHTYKARNKAAARAPAPAPPKTTRIAAMKPKAKSKPAKQREEVKERIRQSQKARKVQTQKPPTSKTVWIGNLRADITDEHLLNAFASCGRISEVTIRVARGSAMLPEKGSTVSDDYAQLYASMTFYDANSTRAALEMDGQELLGRNMDIRGDAWSLMAIEQSEPERTYSSVEKGWNQIKRWTTERTEPNIRTATPKRNGRAGPSAPSPSSPQEFLNKSKLAMLKRALPPTSDD